MHKAKQFKPKKATGSRVFGTRSAAQKGYDGDWRKYRFRFLARNNSCYACGATEKLHVDHIVAHKGDSDLFEKLDNHMPLCHSCHSHVTNHFDKKKVPDVQGKIKWLNDMRAKYSISSRIQVLTRYRKK